MRKQDITGLKFGRLTVLGHVRKQQGNRYPYFAICRCDCGTEKLVQRSHLHRGSTKSCGCLQREMLPTAKYLPGAHFVIKSYKKSAKDRKLEWNLSDADTTKLIESICFYCGSEPQHVITPPDRTVSVDYAYNGIDRIDSSRGYIPGNVVTCCTRCNYSKRNYSQAEFIETCRLVAAKHPKQVTAATG